MTQPEHSETTESSAASATPVSGPVPDEHVSALERAEARLRDEFATVFDFETIHRYLHASYQNFAERATVTIYLPLLAERFGRQRLHALAKVEGRVARPKPTVLFLCTHNAGRSQMALGYFAHFAEGRAVAWSGGSEPSGALNPAAIEAMAEVGVDITEEYPKPWTDEIIRAADVIVTMGCGDTCPLVSGPRYEEWIIEDPAGLPVDEVRPIRDDIGRRVETLLTELGLPEAR